MLGNDLNEFIDDMYHNPEKEITYKVRYECVEAFEKAKIFDGKTKYEAEKDIEVLFG